MEKTKKTAKRIAVENLILQSLQYNIEQAIKRGVELKGDLKSWCSKYMRAKKDTIAKINSLADWYNRNRIEKADWLEDMYREAISDECDRIWNAA